MTMHGIHFRPAMREDISLLEHWEQQPHTIAATQDEPWNWHQELGRQQTEWRELLIAELDRRPIGFVQIIDPDKEETHHWRKLAPHLRAIDIGVGEPEDLGRGYGTVIMRLALERCFANPEVMGVIVDPLFSNTTGRSFYERLGFRFIESKWYDGMNHCAIYRMNRGEWEVKPF